MGGAPEGVRGSRRWDGQEVMAGAVGMGRAVEMGRAVGDGRGSREWEGQ